VERWSFTRILHSCICIFSEKDSTVIGYVPDQIIIPAVEEFAKIIASSDTPIVSPIPVMMK